MYLHPGIYEIVKTVLWNYCFLFLSQLFQSSVTLYKTRQGIRLPIVGIGPNLS